MRNTKKLIAAKRAIKALPAPKNLQLIEQGEEQESLYTWLERQGWYWDNKRGDWYQGDDYSRAKGKFSGSIFEDADNLPTGVVRLRVMTHHDDGEAVNRAICGALQQIGVKVIEVSDKVYENRRGKGVRVYITLQFPESLR